MNVTVVFTVLVLLGATLMAAFHVQLQAELKKAGEVVERGRSVAMWMSYGLALGGFLYLSTLAVVVDFASRPGIVISGWSQLGVAYLSLSAVLFSLAKNLDLRVSRARHSAFNPHFRRALVGANYMIWMFACAGLGLIMYAAFK